MEINDYVLPLLFFVPPPFQVRSLQSNLSEQYPALASLSQMTELLGFQ